MTSAHTYDRTHYEAVLDVRYGYHFNELNQRLYRRLDFLFGFIGLFGGSAAFVGAIADKTLVAAIAGALIAASAIVERLVGAVGKSLEHAEYRQRYAELDSRATRLSVDELDAELKRLQGAGPSGIAALAMPAYNANLLSNGRPDYVAALSVWQRAVALFA